MTFLTDYMLMRQKQAADAQRSPANEAKTTPPVVPLVDQLRHHLLTLPPAQKARLSLPALLPHLKGKYREHPHYIHVAQALQQLGYTPVRSFNKADGDGRRYWLAPASTI